MLLRVEIRAPDGNLNNKKLLMRQQSHMGWMNFSIHKMKNVPKKCGSCNTRNRKNQ